MMKTKFSLFLLVCLLCPLLLAGQDIRISGRVTDEAGKPIGFANVALMRPDSTLVTGQAADGKGRFNLSVAQAGDYLLQVSFVGYVTQTLRLTGIDRDTETGDIVLPEDAVLLEGVTVTASNTVRRIDRQIVLPSPREVAASTSGYDLLGHMQLNGLKVDPVQLAVSTVSGGSVQLRINDVKASSSQVLALKPGDVLRVEYIDRPGMRYAASGVEAVINFIVKQPTAGVNGGLSSANAVSTGFGNNNFYVQANHKRSTFGLQYFVTYRNYDERTMDETQTFNFADGSVRRRVSEGLNTPFSYATHALAATYNLTKADGQPVGHVQGLLVLCLDEQPLQRALRRDHRLRRDQQRAAADVHVEDAQRGAGDALSLPARRVERGLAPDEPPGAEGELVAHPRQRQHGAAATDVALQPRPQASGRAQGVEKQRPRDGHRDGVGGVSR